MNIAFDRSDDHFTNARCACFGQQRLKDEHAALHGVRGQKNLWHKQNTVAEVVANNRHAADKCFGQNVIGNPAAIQQDVHGFFDFFLQAIIQVIEHLRDEVVVVQLAQDDVVLVV